MPIKDLSEVIRLPRLGKIHLGIRHPEKGYPMKTDYFVLPKDHSDYKKLVEVFGEKPKELRILIPVEDEEQWATQYYKAYTITHGLVCKGDGEVSLRMLDTKTGDLPNKTTATVAMKEMACSGKGCPEYKVKKCHEVMNLRFILPEVPGLGVWQIDTGSINSILNINSCARLIKSAFKRISMIPLKLTLESVIVNNPEDGKKQTVFVLHLRTEITLSQLADATREQAKLLMVAGPDMESAYEAQLDQEVEDLFGNGKTLPVKTSPKKTQTIPPTKEELQKGIEKAESEEQWNQMQRQDVSVPLTQPEKGKPADKNAEVKLTQDELLKMEFKNPGEFKAACQKHFKLQGSQVDKEIPLYDLTKPEQRKRAWQQIVGTYFKEEK